MTFLYVNHFNKRTQLGFQKKSEVTKSCLGYAEPVFIDAF